MARKPLGPFSIVPQFDDMLGELGGYVKMPPENHVTEIQKVCPFTEMLTFLGCWP